MRWFTPKDDWTLLKKAQAGDRKAADALVQSLMPKAWSMAYRMMGNEAQAQDVVQESFMRLWSRAHSDLPELNPDAQLSTYFLTIVVNRCKTHWARQREDAMDPVDLDAYRDSLQNADPEPFYTDDLPEGALQVAIAGLPARQKMALCLWAYQDMDVTQIAHALDIAPNAAHQLLHRAKQNLKLALNSAQAPVGMQRSPRPRGTP